MNEVFTDHITVKILVLGVRVFLLNVLSVLCFSELSAFHWWKTTIIGIFCFKK